jgi:DNA-binding CsgD family transcriptional regulator
VTRLGAGIGQMLERLCGEHERFELCGISFFVVAQEVWDGRDTEGVQRKLKLRAVGRLQIRGRNHVILCTHARTGDEAIPPRLAGLLTRRELQIATMVAEGWSDKAIARRLSISEYTVREHVRRMFHKANVSKRAALVSLICRLDPDGRAT